MSLFGDAALSLFLFGDAKDLGDDKIHTGPSSTVPKDVLAFTELSIESALHAISSGVVGRDTIYGFGALPISPGDSVS